MLARRSLLKAIAYGVERGTAFGRTRAMTASRRQMDASPADAVVPSPRASSFWPTRPDLSPSTIKIAASNSSVVDRAAADLICEGENAQDAINTAMHADNLRLFFFNGDYSIDAPINVRSGCVLEGASVRGVVFSGNNAISVFRTSDPATRHEFVMLRSMSVVVGSRDEVGLDLRGFTRSHFDRISVAGFAVGVLFGGDLPLYESCWTNVLSRFRIDNCLTGVKLSGVDERGNSTANQIILTEGELNCRDADGGIAIDAIDAELVVERCDIGYGNASAGIVLGPNANHARIVDSRFEWDAQHPSVHPISIAPSNSHHYFSGNDFSIGCTVPNILDASGPSGRSIQINEFQRDPAFSEGFVDFNTDVNFRRSPTFPNGVHLQGDLNSAFTAANSAKASIMALNTVVPRLALLNGAGLRLYSDEYSNVTMNLDATNGTLSLNGDIVSMGDTPAVSPSSAAGAGATAAIVGTNACGVLTLKTGTETSVGPLARIFWSASKPSAKYAVILTAANAGGATAMARVYADVEDESVSSASVAAVIALDESTTYKFHYVVLSY